MSHDGIIYGIYGWFMDDLWMIYGIVWDYTTQFCHTLRLQMISDDRRFDVTEHIWFRWKHRLKHMFWSWCHWNASLYVPWWKDCFFFAMVIAASLGILPSVTIYSLYFPMAMVTKKTEWFVVCWRQKPGMWFITMIIYPIIKFQPSWMRKYLPTVDGRNKIRSTSW